MAQQTINVGAAPNDGTGTPLRTAFQYTNSNFSELYTATGPSGNNITVPGTATISGDLTVDTNTLKVDSANDRVGIGTASPAAGYKLDVRGILAAGNSAGTIVGGISFSSRPEIGAISNHNLGLIANNTTMHLITPAGVFDWYDGAGGTRMTLNSTGLGIGVTPSAWGSNFRVTQVGQAGSVYGAAVFGYYGTKFNLYNNNTNDIAISTNFVGEYRFELLNGNHVWLNKSTAGTAGVNQTLTQAMTLDASGRLLVGSTTAFTDLTGSKEVKIGDGGIQTFSSAITAATPTNIARGGVGGLVYVGGYNGTGQYGAVVLWTSASATVVSVINGTGSTITFGVSAGFLQITSSLALTQVTASCIRI